MTHPTHDVPSSPLPAGLTRRLLPALAVLGVAGVGVWALDRPSSIGAAGGQDLAVGLDTTTAIPVQPNGPTTTVPGGRATTTTVPPAPSCSGATTAVSGSTVSTRFGPVQVAAQVQGSKLCSVSAPVTPANDRRSQAINAQAIPVLNARALATGTTSFAGVSGATYTTNAYKQSLQSLLDKL